MASSHRVVAILTLAGTIVLAAAGIAGHVPPATAPLASQQEVAGIYAAHGHGILVFALLNCLSTSLLLPYPVVLSIALLRMRPRSFLLSGLQLTGGIFATVGPFLASLFFAAAVVRTENTPQTLATLNDLGIIFIELSTLPALFHGLCVAIAIFRDNSAEPILPRWLAWTGIGWSVLAQGGVTSVFFETGPFSPEGLFGIVLPMVSLFVWLLACTVAIYRIPSDRWRAWDQDALSA